MNCPSRVDETLGHDDWNQSPPTFAADTTTRQDLNGRANSRERWDHKEGTRKNEDDDGREEDRMSEVDGFTDVEANASGVKVYGSGEEPKTPSSNSLRSRPTATAPPANQLLVSSGDDGSVSDAGRGKRLRRVVRHSWDAAGKYAKFIGPGFMISVAYIDPGNYSTDVAAGANFRFRLLFIILMANLFAIFLQSLCIKLGTVTGLNLAENCRAHLPKWLNITLYLFAEAAIIATDIAEVGRCTKLRWPTYLLMRRLQVIGSAIALNLLLHIPLIAGCALTLVDVLLILLLYNPSGSMRRLRAFEFFVAALVLGVVVAFCVQLSYIRNVSVGEVFKGYLPSSTIVQSKGLYLSCGILGATVMPHSLYLGSGIVQPRLHDFDCRAGNLPNQGRDSLDDSTTYRPTLAAIRFCLKYSIIEVAVSLFSFALFVNSSILIVAGASLSDKADAQDADLFGVHDLLSKTLAPVAGTIFALALLLSGTSAGIVCTIAGQMVSEGALNWTITPWLRRLITRAISITPSIIIAGAVGRKGLSAALTASQVVLSVLLPFVSAPIIYFTCRNRYMTVPASGNDPPGRMRNNWLTSILALAIWLIITVMNVALLVLLGLGKA
ncbi:MAG: hypothetical protein M1816_003448 [Peltula sp. TS41687]|nr:MAG: hypothetical protein M1816_003448 [Peltula sp. TS41687]